MKLIIDMGQALQIIQEWAILKGFKVKDQSGRVKYSGMGGDVEAESVEFDVEVAK